VARSSAFPVSSIALRQTQSRLRSCEFANRRAVPYLDRRNWY
jgi:hypothetical protein